MKTTTAALLDKAFVGKRVKFGDMQEFKEVGRVGLGGDVYHDGYIALYGQSWDDHFGSLDINDELEIEGE